MNDTHAHEFEHEWSENQAWTYEATIETGPFNDLCTAVSGLVDEATFRITPDTVSVRAVDPAKVAMVDVELECVTESDGLLSVGIPVNNLPDDLPPYLNPTDEYTLTVDHGLEDGLTINSLTGQRHESDAHDPNTVRDAADWPDGDHDQEATLQAPKVNGAFTGMAQAADHAVRLTPRDGTLLLEANDDDGEWIYDWEIDAPDITPGEPQLYSADYLRDITSRLWPGGEYTVRFGHGQPLELETDGLRFILAPRVMTE